MQQIHYLISRDDLLPFRKISANLKGDQVNPFIQDAQEFELRPFLGDDLYMDFLEKYEDDKYQKLLDGETYESPAGSGKNKRFLGISTALAYFVLELITSEGHIHHTATGSFEKDNDFSSKLSGAERARIANNYREKALRTLSDAKTYLNAKREDFPLWKNAPPAPDQPTSAPQVGRVHRLKKFNNRHRHSNGDDCE